MDTLSPKIDGDAISTPATRMYVPLHVHSYYSILDGQAPIEGLVDKAVACGMPGIALTDHGVMYGIKEFTNYVQKINGPKLGAIKDLKKELQSLTEQGGVASDLIQAKEAEIEALEQTLFKPIIGCEAYVAQRSRLDKDPSAKDPYRPNRSIDQSGHHLILLAKNLIGYKNLIKMVSLSWEEGEYYKPRIDKELLEKYHEGIIVCSACLGGEVPQHILHNRLDKAVETVQWFKGVFGDDYYLEIQLHKSDIPLSNRETYHEQLRVAEAILRIAEETGVKVVATNDTHFLNQEDAEAHDHLICLMTNTQVNDPDRLLYTKQEWLKSPEEMSEVFRDYPDVLENTVEVCRKVEIFSIDHKPLMPHFELPDGFTNEDDYLRYLTYEGAKERYGDPVPENIQERLDMELGVIQNMGFPGYFLVVQDFIKAARTLGVRVGPGRGSAAGSAVAYCLTITNIDPIRFDLLFERFLNPDRISMPDIDVDFDNEGRAKILEWVVNKYGRDHVSNIITTGKMATKSAIKDVARVEGLPLSDANRLCKLIPDRKPDGVKAITVDWMMKNDKDFQEAAVSRDVRMSNTVKYASQLEGTVRNTGVHACGVIISGVPINEVVPLSTATDEKTGEKRMVTQYDGRTIEATGLIKMDFLGLITLTLIKEAVDNVKKSYGIEIDIDRISLDDEKTFELYSAGDTIGTFQFESAGMQKYLKSLQPTKFEDLVAMNALYRPGPMDNIPDFIQRKHGEQEISYDFPEMEPYLSSTYGITVYQEQVMQLSRVLGGFTRGDSDSLRKAMGKKNEKQMAEYQVKFVKGGVEKGFDKKKLEDLYAGWQKFASYAFNKSHSVCYAWLAYQTAYLKAHYPAQFMASVLTCNQNDAPKLTKYLEEVKRMGLEVKGPDVNESYPTFSVNKEGAIRFGLGGVKGVGLSVAEDILREREENGEYKDIFDFVARMDLSSCNGSTMESLVYAGAFDGFGIDREVFFTPMEGNRDETFLQSLVRYGKAVQTETLKPKMSLFGMGMPGAEIPAPKPPQSEPWSDLERLNKERNCIGIFLSAHPLDPYHFTINYGCNCKAVDLEDRDSLPDTCMVAGMVTNVRNGFTKKKGEPYAIITIEDTSGAGEIALFGSDFVQFGNFAKKDLAIIVKMTKEPSRYNPDEIRLTIANIELLSAAEEHLITGVELRIDVTAVDMDAVDELVDNIQSHPGDVSTQFVFTDAQAEIMSRMSGPSIKPGKWLSDCIDSMHLGCSVSN